MPLPTFEIDFKVRDYELDLQGIVNNANYLHYFEHARHEFLYAYGIDFEDLHKQGIDLIVTRLEIEYKNSLHSREHFRVITSVSKDGNLRILFTQQIIKLSDMKTIALANVWGVALNKGKPVGPEKIPELNRFITGDER